MPSWYLLPSLLILILPLLYLLQVTDGWCSHYAFKNIMCWFLQFWCPLYQHIFTHEKVICQWQHYRRNGENLTARHLVTLFPRPILSLQGMKLQLKNPDKKGLQKNVASVSKLCCVKCGNWGNRERGWKKKNFSCKSLGQWEKNKTIHHPSIHLVPSFLESQSEKWN